ncbi:MAG TPA: hypothetical protein VFS21_03480 [Roseiflexaceae bacterium]|nr:hypothetical protein [Roseiflexaceae bacterium]
MDAFAAWLERQRAAPPQEGGITVMHLLDLPGPLRSLLRLLLRQGPMSQQELAEQAAAHPAPECLTPAELDTALELLSQQGWLQRLDEPACPRYRLRLRHKGQGGRPGHGPDSP